MSPRSAVSPRSWRRGCRRSRGGARDIRNRGLGPRPSLEANQIEWPGLDSMQVWNPTTPQAARRLCRVAAMAGATIRETTVAG